VAVVVVVVCELVDSAVDGWAFEALSASADFEWLWAGLTIAVIVPRVCHLRDFW
jgi:hypothetical protein